MIGPFCGIYGNGDFCSLDAIGCCWIQFSSNLWCRVGDGRLWWGYFLFHDDNVRTFHAANLFSYFCIEPYNECIAVFFLSCSCNVA
jgi:hypothetical protein